MKLEYFIGIVKYRRGHLPKDKYRALNIWCNCESACGYRKGGHLGQDCGLAANDSGL